MTHLRRKVGTSHQRKDGVDARPHRAADAARLRRRGDRIGCNLLHCICRLMARTGPLWTGRAGPLCPGKSDVNLFRYGKCIIDLDTEIPGGAFDFGVAEQKLNGAEISSAAVDQGWALVRRSECVPKRFGSSPTLAILSIARLNIAKS